MAAGNIVSKHRLFFVFLILFFVVAAVDIVGLDSIVYQQICIYVAPFRGNAACTPFYDVPIWSVYLSLALLAALYHVHDEVRTTNRHLSSKK